jgi:hypothetical protein
LRTSLCIAETSSTVSLLCSFHTIRICCRHLCRGPAVFLLEAQAAARQPPAPHPMHRTHRSATQHSAATPSLSLPTICTSLEPLLQIGYQAPTQWQSRGDTEASQADKVVPLAEEPCKFFPAAWLVIRASECEDEINPARGVHCIGSAPVLAVRLK